MIYVFLAPGFEETEALATVDILRRAGDNVATVGVMDNVIKGAHGIRVVTDVTMQDVQGTHPDVIVLPGGMPGTLHLENCQWLAEMIREAYRDGKLIAAICAAPSILGHMGLLTNRKATCFPGFEGELLGAEVVPQQVCRDGQFITANGPGAAMAFGLEIVRALHGDAAARKIGEAMQYVS